MIDLKAARNDPDAYRAALARKGAGDAFDALLEADERWRALVPRIDELRGKTKLKGKPSPEQLAELQQVKEELKAAEEELRGGRGGARPARASRPEPRRTSDVPDGSTEDDVEEVRRVGEPPRLEERARAHSRSAASTWSGRRGCRARASATGSATRRASRSRSTGSRSTGSRRKGSSPCSRRCSSARRR